MRADPSAEANPDQGEIIKWVREILPDFNPEKAGVRLDPNKRTGMCNPTLPTADWRVAKVGEEVGLQRQVVLTLNEETVKALEMMEHRLNNEDHVAAAIESPNGPLRICSAYMGHDQEALSPHPLIKKLVEDSRKHKIDLIIGCDANAHHHQCTEPTFIVKNRREVLDVTLYSESLADSIARWGVLEKHSFSDHRYIELVVNFENFNRLTVRNPRKANWELYRKKLESSLGKPRTVDVDSREALDAMVNTLTATCAKAFNKACPKSRSGNSKSKKPPWWSQALAPFKTKGRKAFNFASKRTSETAWES
ncbi:uncharacterized protein [Drosophila bipectinata]|uniref:uncharacterized protein n=1 Tax=Drosophila bipectinata TaxID=42026 RepID=UPI0038B379ED